MKNLLTSFFLAVLTLVALPLPALQAEEIKDIRVILKTNKGSIEATLFASKTPITVTNFLNLAQHKFYNGLTFHRVIPDFMIQGGDPLGTGTGNPGYSFTDEFVSSLRFDKPGLWAMANSGPGTNGSQFFITHVPTSHLNDRHTIFGETTKGQDVVNAIAKGDTIESIEILDDTKALFASQQAYLEKWNSSLKKK